MASRVRLLIWPDYVDPATLVGFEQETGVQIDVEIVPSAFEILERLRSDVDSPDVLVPPQYAVMELNAEGRLAQLDHKLLPNLHYIEERFLHGRPHDPESRVSIIKDWGTTGFMFRSDKIMELPNSWRDFWRLAEQHSGRITVLDSPSEVIGAALKMRGHSYNASGAEELEQARSDLLRLKPHLLAFETNYRPLLASGEAWLSLGWNGDAAALVAQGIHVRYVIPEEGSQIWEDDWAIAAHAPNRLDAHRFVNYVLRPDVAAREARYTRYATGNAAARAMLDASIRDDPATYPPERVLEKLETGMPQDPEGEKRRSELWKEIRG